MSFEDVELWWRSLGLNLFVSLDWAVLPQELRSHVDLKECGFVPKRLLMWGHGGRRLWESLNPEDWAIEAPIDHWSQKTIAEGMEKMGVCEDTHWLYPFAPLHFPLQRVGALVGWHSTSPLGVGIHPSFGLWFAYRGALVTALEWPLSVLPPMQETPCASCQEKPCVAICPAQAVSKNDALDGKRCMNYRLEEASSCATRCFSRSACPIGAEHRYLPAQMQYHATHSLNAIRRWSHL